MAATLTLKLEQLDSIIKGAKKIQKQVMETVVAENILRDDINRFTGILDQDEELRDNIRYKGVIAKDKIRKHERQTKWRTPKGCGQHKGCAKPKGCGNYAVQSV